MSLDNTQQLDNSQFREGVFCIEKHKGETLAVLVDRFRTEKGIDSTVPITYAGRLDPMASGLMLLLVGEACKKKDMYLGLDKTYTFEVLFGVATDTYDMLGLVTGSSDVMPTKEDIQNAFLSLQQETHFSYPPYSSKTIMGKPLFVYAREGGVPETMPTKEGKIYSIKLSNTRTESLEKLINDSVVIIETVQGDFRQDEIIQGWQNLLKDMPKKRYVVATVVATVSSGVYIRTVATMVAKCIGCFAVAYSIKRDNIGEYKI